MKAQVVRAVTATAKRGSIERMMNDDAFVGSVSLRISRFCSVVAMVFSLQSLLCSGVAILKWLVLSVDFFVLLSSLLSRHHGHRATRRFFFGHWWEVDILTRAICSSRGKRSDICQFKEKERSSAVVETAPSLPTNVYLLNTEYRIIVWKDSTAFSRF